MVVPGVATTVTGMPMIDQSFRSHADHCVKHVPAGGPEALVWYKLPAVTDMW